MAKLAEQESKLVSAGEEISYTPLAGGCMAVTVYFKDGGGAGVHLVMGTTKSGPTSKKQWNPFLDLIKGKSIKSAYLDGDMIGQEQGWYVKYGEDDGPDISKPPTSKWELGDEEGWGYTKAMVKDWFGKLFGITPTISEKTENVSHKC